MSLKKRDMYLILILNLMRGVVTKKRFGIMPNSLINFFLKPNRIRYHLRHRIFTRFALQLISIIDFTREKIAKPIFRSMPLDFKIWYDRVRYRL